VAVAVAALAPAIVIATVAANVAVGESAKGAQGQQYWEWKEQGQHPPGSYTACLRS
jgi:hypothetical protein